jgi:ribonuclease HII
VQQPKLPQAKAQRFWEITQLEKAARSQGFSKIAGVDEAGRGPLAGPVVAVACILPEGFFIDQIDDSKRLSAEQRDRIFSILMNNPDVQYGIGIVEPFVIDQINILQATLQAMATAVLQIRPPPDFVLVDGHKKPPLQMPCQAVVKGDTSEQQIMAAAIIAKVTRDRKMKEYDQQFPEYGFSSHKGYPTPEHLAALKKWGPCSIHRQSYAPVKRSVR